MVGCLLVGCVGFLGVFVVKNSSYLLCGLFGGVCGEKQFLSLKEWVCKIFPGFENRYP